MSGCQFSLDRMIDEHVGLPAGTAPFETPEMRVRQCSTVRVDIIFSDAADSSLVPSFYHGDEEDGSDLELAATGIDFAPVGQWTAQEWADKDKEDLDSECDPPEDGTDPAPDVPNRYASYEFCPCKSFFKVSFDTPPVGGAEVIVRQLHCRTTPPCDGMTAPGHKAYKMVCMCN